jgi:hypothetical protein
MELLYLFFVLLYNIRAHSLRLLVLERHNTLKCLKVSNDETLRALHFQIKYTEDYHVHSMTTGVNPTDCHVLDFLDPS